MVDCKFCWHPYCEHAGEQRGFVVECANYTPLVKPEGKTMEFKRWRYTPEPQTNADRIRAMSDEELAEFLAAKFTDLQTQQLHQPTATQLSALAHTWYCQWMYWLKQPASGGDNNG